MIGEVLHCAYAPHELVLQWADRHCNLQAALESYLQRGAVLLKHEVKPLWCSSTDHKHSHGDVNGEAAKQKGQLRYKCPLCQQALCGRPISAFTGDCWWEATSDLMLPSESLHLLKRCVALLTQGG